MKIRRATRSLAAGALPACLSVSLLAPAASAQSGCISYPDSKLNTGVSSMAPFGHKDRNDKKKANQYMQFIVPGSLFGTKPVDLRSVAPPSQRSWQGALTTRMGRYSEEAQRRHGRKGGEDMLRTTASPH